MSTTAVTNDLVAAYSATNYHVLSDDGFFVFKIGQRSHELAHRFVLTDRSGATFITAENPFSQTVTAEENAANQTSLYQDLASTGAAIIKGAGQGEDPTWPAEASYLAIGISPENACELGRKYRQNAILWIGANAVPELVFLR